MLELTHFTHEQDDGWARSGWSRYRNTSTHTQREWFDRGSFFRQVDEGAPVKVEWRDLWLTGGLTEAGLWLREALPRLQSLWQDYTAPWGDDLDEDQYKEALGATLRHLSEMEASHE